MWIEIAVRTGTHGFDICDVDRIFVENSGLTESKVCLLLLVFRNESSIYIICDSLKERQDIYDGLAKLKGAVTLRAAVEYPATLVYNTK